MSLSFPGNKEHLRPGEVSGDDLVLAETYRYLHDVFTIAADRQPSNSGFVAEKAAVPHVPSWRGGSDAAAQFASDLLAERLIRFRRDAVRFRLSPETANDIQYALVCAADLILSNRVWHGQQAWKDSPLEHRLFDTADGRQRVPEQAKRALEMTGPDGLRLQRIYLLVLRAAPFDQRRLGDELAASLPIARAGAGAVPVAADMSDTPDFGGFSVKAFAAVGVAAVVFLGASWAVSYGYGLWIEQVIARIIGS